MKVQLVVAKKSKCIICTAHGTGKIHDFRVLKKSKLPLHKGVKKKLNSGYQGVEKLYENCMLPKKGSKHHPLTQKDKMANRKEATEQVMVEHVIGRIKVFRIKLERHRNRRQMHNLRVKLICTIYNYEL